MGGGVDVCRRGCGRYATLAAKGQKVTVVNWVRSNAVKHAVAGLKHECLNLGDDHLTLLHISPTLLRMPVAKLDQRLQFLTARLDLSDAQLRKLVSTLPATLGMLRDEEGGFDGYWLGGL